MKTTRVLLTLAAIAATGPAAHAAFIVEANNGLATATNFSYGADSTSASASTTPSFAVGLTSAGSIFGGNGSNASTSAADFDPATADTYVFSYTPGTNADNYSPAPGALLGSTTGFGTEVATGAVGGTSGTYRVFLTIPASTNVNAAGSQVTITGDGAPIVIPSLNMNNGGTGPDLDPGAPFVGGANNSWYLLGSVNLTAGNTYSVSLAANVNSFVSFRSVAPESCGNWSQEPPSPSPPPSASPPSRRSQAWRSCVASGKGQTRLLRTQQRPGDSIAGAFFCARPPSAPMNQSLRQSIGTTDSTDLTDDDHAGANAASKPWPIA